MNSYFNFYHLCCKKWKTCRGKIGEKSGNYAFQDNDDNNSNDG